MNSTGLLILLPAANIAFGQQGDLKHQERADILFRTLFIDPDVIDSHNGIYNRYAFRDTSKKADTRRRFFRRSDRPSSR